MMMEFLFFENNSIGCLNLVVIFWMMWMVLVFSKCRWFSWYWLGVGFIVILLVMVFCFMFLYLINLVGLIIFMVIVIYVIRFFYCC